MKTETHSLTPMQRERMVEFLKDLRANTKQAIKEMRSADGGRCCLCVAYDTAQRLGACLPAIKDNQLPPSEIAEFYGWKTPNPMLRISPSTLSACASMLNDRGTCHAEIADLFEKEYLT